MVDWLSMRSVRLDQVNDADCCADKSVSDLNLISGRKAICFNETFAIDEEIEIRYVSMQCCVNSIASVGFVVLAD